MKALGLLSLVFAMGACSSAHPDEDESLATLSIEPASVELLLANGVPATQDYVATLTFPDGHTRDVTDETLFTVEGNYGSFFESTATISVAGKTNAIAQRDDKTATGVIIARLKSTRVDPSLDPNTPDKFNGADDPARKPQLVYPADRVVMPRNLGDFEIHWTDPSGNDVFELSLLTEFTDVKIYVPGGNGNPAAGPMPSFSAFLPAEWAGAVANEPTVSFRVRGIQAANPTSVGASEIRLAKLTNETMEGGLYYWAAAATNGVYGIYRHDMAKPGEPAEEYMTTNQTGGRCVACHVLSRDGTKMAITYDGGNRNGTMVDVATSTRQPDFTQWNFATFTPDGNQLLTTYDGVLTIRNSSDQSAITTMPAAGPVSHPDLSTDGTQLVYVREAGGADWAFAGGQLFTRTYDQVTRTFGAEVPLVTDGGNNFYPSWSPDGKWILFNRSVGNGSAYNNSEASLWVVKADGSAPPIQLVAANSTGALTNSWGRWAPFEQTVGANGEQLYWITVSSKRDFGVRLVGAGRPQIWMTPFFPETALTGVDPTVVAFRLPFQGIDSNNHIAQWTERVVGTL